MKMNNFSDNLLAGYTIPHPNYDCSEIARDLLNKAKGNGYIIRFQGKNQRDFIKIMEHGRVDSFEYHEVYTDGKNVYEPRHHLKIIPLQVYLSEVKRLNGPDLIIKELR